MGVLYIGSFVAARGAAATASVLGAWALGSVLHLAVVRPLGVYAYTAACFFGVWDGLRGALPAALVPWVSSREWFPGPALGEGGEGVTRWVAALALPLAASEASGGALCQDEAVLAFAPLQTLLVAWEQPFPSLASLRTAVLMRTLDAARREWLRELASGSGSGSSGGALAASAGAGAEATEGAEGGGKPHPPPIINTRLEDVAKGGGSYTPASSFSFSSSSSSSLPQQYFAAPSTLSAASHLSDPMRNPSTFAHHTM